jgi:signal transduction histidine kinase
LGVLAYEGLSRVRAAHEDALDILLDEARTRAGELEGAFGRIERELAGFARTPWRPADGPAAALTLVDALRGRLADSDRLVEGILLQDPEGRVVASAPRSLGSDPGTEAAVTWTAPRPDGEQGSGLDGRSAPAGAGPAGALPGSRSGDGGAPADPPAGTARAVMGPRLTVRTGGRLPDGSPALGLSVPMMSGLDTVAVLTALVAPEREPESSPFRDYSGLDPYVLLLDSAGVILSHPRREWIGQVILTAADSLYDPEIWRRLPRILGEDEEGWAMVSEVLSPGSWLRTEASLLAVVHLRPPAGGPWHLGLAATPGGHRLPGTPSPEQLAGMALLLTLVLVGATYVLPRYRALATLQRSAEAEAAWYRALALAGPDGLLVLDGGERVVAANAALGHLVGRPPEAIEGTHVRELIEMGPGGGRALSPGFSEARLGGEGPQVEAEVHAAEFSLYGRTFLLCLVRDMGWRRRVERETLRVGEKERLLLGKELHDGLGQHMTGVAFMAKTLSQRLADRGSDGADEVERIGHLLKDAVGQIRILSKGLELSEYEGQELPGALEEMSAVARRLMGVAVALDLQPGLAADGGGLDRMQATQVYRLCHDVVSDAVRNRLAQNIRITIGRTGDRMTIHIVQDGRRPRAEVSEGPAMPDYRLRYRARLLDATLNVSEDGGATTTCSFRVAGAGT